VKEMVAVVAGFVVPYGEKHRAKEPLWQRFV
jgi:hypothetical protein